MPSQESVDRADLARCAAIKATDIKLACFESLAEEPRHEDGTSPASSPAGAPAASPAAGDEAADPPASEPRTEVPRAPPDLGSEYLEDEEGDDERAETVSATVEEVWKGGNRLLYFRFSNGQIWRQMESGYFYYPRNGRFNVTIRQGFMGDYQMRLAGRGRMTRIVRVQ